MNNKDILQAHLLDILFDGRNKEYGAYAIRRGYNHRMGMALGIGLSLILLLLLINRFNGNSSSSPNDSSKPDIQLTVMDMASQKLPEQPKQKPAAQKPPEAVKTIKNTTIDIVPDNTLKRTEAADVNTLNENATGDKTIDGPPSDGKMAVKQTDAGDGKETTAIAEPVPPAPSFPPEFPGGLKALQEFLAKNLVTPEELEVGDKKVVRARFFVDKDGSVSIVEIDMSGGRLFDKEVIRVCKKMPKWKPAMQNGHAVAISYVLPVTFVGVEQ
jgi:protein TonB